MIRTRFDVTFNKVDSIRKTIGEHTSYNNSLTNPTVLLEKVDSTIDEIIQELALMKTQIKAFVQIEEAPFKQGDFVIEKDNPEAVPGKVWKVFPYYCEIILKNHVTVKIAHNLLKKTESWGHPHNYQQYTECCLSCGENEYAMGQKKSFLPCEGRQKR